MYDKEQSQTTDLPTALRGRDTEHKQPHNSKLRPILQKKDTTKPYIPVHKGTNNNRITILERTASEATRGLKYILLAKSLVKIMLL